MQTTWKACSFRYKTMMALRAKHNFSWNHSFSYRQETICNRSGAWVQSWKLGSHQMGTKSCIIELLKHQSKFHAIWAFWSKDFARKKMVSICTGTGMSQASNWYYTNSKKACCHASQLFPEIATYVALICHKSFTPYSKINMVQEIHL